MIYEVAWTSVICHERCSSMLRHNKTIIFLQWVDTQMSTIFPQITKNPKILNRTD